MLDGSMPTMPGDSPSGGKSFWSKPEGKMGLAINLVVAAVIIYFWGEIVPFLLAAALDTFHLAIVVAATFAIGFVLLDSTIRNRAWFVYRAAMRAMTNAFVARDPIGIRKTILEKSRTKKEELDETIGEIRGQRQKLERAVNLNKSTYADSKAKLKVAAKIKDDPDPEKQRQARRIEVLESAHVTGLDTLLTSQTKQLERYDFVVNVLTRYSEVCDDTISTMTIEIGLKQQEIDQAKSFQKGMHKVFGILHGSMEDNEMQQMADEALENDYAKRMGEVENILNLTKNDILKADFNDAAAMEKASHLLDTWKGDNPDATAPKVHVDPTDPAASVRPGTNYF